jgi:hypothetical protein
MIVDIDDSHFVLMNASVRGPFLGWGIRDTWLDYFLAQITDKVKLVGTSINCLSDNSPDTRLPGRRFGGMHLQVHHTLRMTFTFDVNNQ